MGASEGSSVFSAQEKVSMSVTTGVCRFPARVECWLEDGLLRCSITSDCPHVREFAAAIEPLDMMEVVRMPFAENQVYIIAGRTLKHSTCPMPMAVLKGFEAAAGLALKRDVAVVFDK